MQQDALKVEGISCGYGRAMILNSLSLEIKQSQCVAMLGKNGMGKSTLLKALCGFLPKKQGEVYIEGKRVTHYKPHRIARLNLAYAAQEQAIFTELTVKENLSLALAHPDTFDQVFIPVGHLFPVFRERLAQKAGTLSGGEQKMLLVARCLIQRPDIIFLDEITEGLQPSVIDKIAEALDWERRSHGTAMFIIEQNIGFALRVSDRYLILKQGRIVDSGDSKAEGAAKKVYGYLTV